MPRIKQVDVGGYVYHVIRRSNARIGTFDTDDPFLTPVRYVERRPKHATSVTKTEQ